MHLVNTRIYLILETRVITALLQWPMRFSVSSERQDKHTWNHQGVSEHSRYNPAPGTSLLLIYHSSRCICSPATLGSMLFLQDAEHIPAPGPLHLLFLLPGTLFPEVHPWLSSSFHSVLCFNGTSSDILTFYLALPCFIFFILPLPNMMVTTFL